MGTVDWSVVYVSQGPLGAELAKSKLEAHGVSAVLRYEAIGRELGITVDGLGRVEVLVSEAELQAALEILMESDDDPDIKISDGTSP